MKKILLAMLLAGGVVHAAPPYEESSPDSEILTAGFLYHHPDLKHRLLGLEAYEAGKHAEALAEFKRSSKWADKASQAMVAEMLWKGEGTEPDPVTAYVWMDLAAERGYRGFIAKREQYWAALDEAQRARAVETGQAVYAEFGDDVAKERLARRIEQGRRTITGSRTGMVGNLKIMVPGPGGWTSIDGSTYYKDQYWRPQEYFDWQDRIWSAPPVGTVEIGPIAGAEGEENGSRTP